MDWQDLRQHHPRDNDLPERAANLIALRSVLDGRQYDVLEHPFAKERSDGGDYIPLFKRRPSVKTGLCRQVVDDAVSLLFSEGHWPTVKADDADTEKALLALVAGTRLQEVMIQAATLGAVGSVAIRLQVFDSRPFYDVLTTEFLTPEWNPRRPDELVRVTEQFKVKARDLVAMGYDVDLRDGDHWFRRVWDKQAETWFLPWPVVTKSGEKQPTPRVDEARTVTHGLGFVPMVWVRNLTATGAPDGICTFEAGIDVIIEADYLMSQAGRALRYGSDPTLVLKDPTAGSKKDGATHTGGAASALILPPDGDAKLLELNGGAAVAVLKHFQQLRETALEVMHGNRSHGDKLSAAQSGRAMEMMCQGLIWLADRMRLSYGEGALLALLRLTCRASAEIKGGLLVGDEPLPALDPKGLHLRWAPWFAPTYGDMQTLGQAVAALLPIGAVSREAAVTMLIPATGIQDVTSELGLIAADIAETDARAIKLKAVTTAGTGTAA